MKEYQGLEAGSIDWGGRGPAVVIVHSAGLSAGVYEPFAQRLKPDFHLFGLDLPGHGQVKAPYPAAGLRNWGLFYDGLEKFLDNLGQPAIIIGHSMGGTIGLVVAARRPDLATALVLIEPGVMPAFWRPWVWMVQKLGLAMHVPFVTRAVNRKKHWPDASAAAESIRGKGPFKAWRDDFIDAYLAHGFETGETGETSLVCDPLWEGRCLAMAPTDVWRHVPRVKASTMVLYGARSTTFLPSVAKKFRTCLPEVDIRKFDAGHYIPMEKPGECADAVLDFLKAAGTRP